MKLKQVFFCYADDEVALYMPRGPGVFPEAEIVTNLWLLMAPHDHMIFFIFLRLPMQKACFLLTFIFKPANFSNFFKCFQAKDKKCTKNS